MINIFFLIKIVMISGIYILNIKLLYNIIIFISQYLELIYIFLTYISKYFIFFQIILNSK